MKPGSVWLSLIPMFSVWGFFMATRIPESLRKEFSDRGQETGSNYGKGIGLVWAIVYATVVVSYFAMHVVTRMRMLRPELVGPPWMLLALISLFLFFIFSAKIARYGNRLAAPVERPDGDPALSQKRTLTRTQSEDLFQ
jgi:hypothetical protein